MLVIPSVFHSTAGMQTTLLESKKKAEDSDIKTEGSLYMFHKNPEFHRLDARFNVYALDKRATRPT